MGNPVTIEVSLMCKFLELEFPKGRYKSPRNTKRFKRGVIIPSNYTNKPTLICNYNSNEEKKILFHQLKVILYKVFSFDEMDINISILKHFDLL